MKLFISTVILMACLAPLNSFSASKERTIGWVSETALKKKAPVKLKLYSAPSIKAYMKTIRVEKNSDFKKISNNLIVNAWLVTDSSTGIPIKKDSNGFYKLQGGAWVRKQDVKLISLEDAFVKTTLIIRYRSKDYFYKSPGKEKLTESKTWVLETTSFLTPIELKPINDNIWVKVIDIDPTCPSNGEVKLKGPLWIPLYRDDGTMNLSITDKDC